MDRRGLAHLDVAVGNILGGIALQTVVLINRANTALLRTASQDTNRRLSVVATEVGDTGTLPVT